MKSRIAYLAAVAAIFAGVSPSGATPSTLVWIPSTDLQSPGTLHFGQDNYFPHEGNSLLDLGLTYGLPKAEIGFDYITPGNDPWSLNAKVLLTDESSRRPRLVLGGYGFGTDSNTTAFNIVYALASKTLADGSRLTLGYGQGRKATLGPDSGMVLAGIDKSFNSRWWGAVDYQGGDSAFGALSFGAAYAFSGGTSLILGYDFYNAPGVPGTVTAQVDVNF
jgi:hypothetical protein